MAEKFWSKKKKKSRFAILKCGTSSNHNGKRLMKAWHTLCTKGKEWMWESALERLKNKLAYICGGGGGGMAQTVYILSD